MAESTKHIQLVDCIVKYVHARYTGAQSVVGCHDLPGTIGCDKPPFIGSHRPDVFAVDAPLTTTIVGEAKTQADLETARTYAQLCDFIGFLRLQKNPVFILAVPWQAKARGRCLIDSILTSRGIGSSTITVIVLDEV